MGLWWCNRSRIKVCNSRVREKHVWSSLASGISALHGEMPPGLEGSFSIPSPQNFSSSPVCALGLQAHLRVNCRTRAGQAAFHLVSFHRFLLCMYWPYLSCKNVSYVGVYVHVGMHEGGVLCMRSSVNVWRPGKMFSSQFSPSTAGYGDQTQTVKTACWNIADWGILLALLYTSLDLANSLHFNSLHGVLSVCII